jgi:hypothetical protein
VVLVIGVQAATRRLTNFGKGSNMAQAAAASNASGWRGRFWGSRRGTVQQQMEKLMLEQAEMALAKGDMKLFDSLAGKLLGARPSAREDRLDTYRVLATTIMIAALFTIVVVIVLEKKPSTNLFQFVSLASGLAGIGLGWLFGTAASRGSGTTRGR